MRRRRKSRKRRVLHALERALPVLVIGIAAVLSAGVIRVMEVGKPIPQSSVATPDVNHAAFAEAAKPRSGPSLSVDSDTLPPVLPTLPGHEASAESLENVLSASVLDANDRSLDVPAALDDPSAESLDEVLPNGGDVVPDERSFVPEPGTLLLVATGLAWTTRVGRGAISPS